MHRRPHHPAPSPTPPRRTDRPRRRAAPGVALAVLLPTALGAGALPAAGGTPSPAVARVAAAADLDACPWMDTTLDADERTRLLLDASTRHQKYRWLVEQAANAPEQTVFGGVTYPAQVPCTPRVVYTDGPDGVRFTPGVTAFPAPIALASAWDTGLAQEKAAAQAAEAFDTGKNVVLGPGLASGRTPLSGRTAEYFGEDPLLTGLLTASSVNGLQDGDPERPVLADLKHFVANEQELDRQRSSSDLDERTLRETYALPFEIALAGSDPASIMCSYNQVNGAYGCENSLLTTLLKDELGFDGYVVSDFGAVHSTAPSLVNGLDQELNRPVWYTPERLDAAVAAGQITEAQVDAAAARVVRSYVAGGLFDHPLPAVPSTDASTPEHKAVALRAAQEGSVLLKNTGVLPLDLAEGATVALIGPTARAERTGGVGAADVCSMPWRFTGAGTLLCEDLVTPEDALRARAAEAGATVVVDTGEDLAAAAATAAAADVAVVLGHQRLGEFADASDLHLQGGGDALVAAVAAANDDTVVVLQTGSAVEMPWVDDVDAVLEAWYGGEQGGPAIASLLFGDVSPSGRLPMTFPRLLADTPTAGSAAQYPGTFADGGTERPAGSEEIRRVDYAEGRAVGYRWYQERGVDPLFAFGHGLTYTSFAYDDLTVTPRSTDGDRALRVRFRLTNTGGRAGTETAQAYVTLPGSAGDPGSRLVGWQEVTLEPGASRWVEIVLTEAELAEHRALQHWDDVTERWTTAAGRYTVAVGGSSEADLTASFTVRSTRGLAAALAALREDRAVAGPLAFLLAENVTAAQRHLDRGQDAAAAQQLTRLVERLASPPAGSTLTEAARARLTAQAQDARAALTGP
ncbi:glycoside hydrolase family 3 C-terminal domain-containing protein [Cellulomonas endophytica]|uniref:glycoside hydrolase family 3 C-terminal domain-containing protein n=1 Tax=Cellulomonas endophytica TaxID=2494735 RepID=UPI00196BAF4F|nr:glycoside hydrolase family 3 C-terminal domain-containing protein [Cellulomonas endophytica]